MDDGRPRLRSPFSTPEVTRLPQPNADLYKRIGFVESWGEPRFRFRKRIAMEGPA